MSVAQYWLSWDSYKSNICNGFTNLQQNEEFVDMTLAADGHLVKVHKSILALASPYIKSMLESTPNQHPILYLDNVSQEVLNYILMYVYTGEVNVEVDKIQSFMRVAKHLRLRGLYGLSTEKVGTKEEMEGLHTKNTEQRVMDNATLCTRDSVVENVTDNEIITDSASESEVMNEQSEVLATNKMNPINVKIEQNTLSSNLTNSVPTEGILNDRDSGLYLTADGYQYKLDIQEEYNKCPDDALITVEDIWNNAECGQAPKSTNVITVGFNNKCLGFIGDKNNASKIEGINLSMPSVATLDPKALTPQYTKSSRGSLQLILNRYMYYSHHQSHGGRKRRWRCIDYRSKHCPAFIDTDGDVMTVRKFGHAHSFHDEKIRKKMKKDVIYTSLNILLEKIRDTKKGTKIESE